MDGYAAAYALTVAAGADRTHRLRTEGGGSALVETTLGLLGAAFFAFFAILFTILIVMVFGSGPLELDLEYKMFIAVFSSAGLFFCAHIAYFLGNEPLHHMINGLRDLKAALSLGRPSSHWLRRWRFVQRARQIWTRKSREDFSPVPFRVSGFNHDAASKGIIVDGVRPAVLVRSLLQDFMNDVMKVAGLSEQVRDSDILLRLLESRSELKQKCGSNTWNVEVEYDHGYYETTNVGTSWNFVYPSIHNIVVQILECRRSCLAHGTFVERLNEL